MELIQPYNLLSKSFNISFSGTMDVESILQILLMIHFLLTGWYVLRITTDFPKQKIIFATEISPGTGKV